MCRHSTTVSMPHPRWRTALASGLLTLLALWPLAAQPQTVQTIKLVVGYAVDRLGAAAGRARRGELAMWATVTKGIVVE